MHNAVSILLSLRRLVTWAIMDLPWRILHKHYKNCFFFKFNVLYIFTKYNYGGSKVKASPCNVEDPGLIPGWGRFPGEGNGNPLQYSCLENPCFFSDLLSRWLVHWWRWIVNISCCSCIIANVSLHISEYLLYPLVSLILGIQSKHRSLFATPWSLQSMEFAKPEYWNG